MCVHLTHEKVRANHCDLERIWQMVEFLMPEKKICDVFRFGEFYIVLWKIKNGHSTFSLTVFKKMAKFALWILFIPLGWYKYF